MSHNVLLVDDDLNLLAGLRRTLRREPYEILVAQGATEAFEVLGTKAIDVIVSDEAMPGMSGTDFLARVSLIYPETIRIILTGNATLDTAVRAINEGKVYRFLTKPCNPFDLAITIRQALEHRDLLVKSRQLLREVRRQAAVIQDLEREARGITQVNRDESGAIVVNDPPVDPSRLLKDLECELELTEERLLEHGAPVAEHGGRAPEGRR